VPPDAARRVLLRVRRLARSAATSSLDRLAQRVSATTSHAQRAEIDRLRREIDRVRSDMEAELALIRAEEAGRAP
jgi:hypothetical protein